MIFKHVNNWRVVPRILVAMYGYICWDTHQWFTALPDPTTNQQIYASLIWGAAAVWFGFYVNTKGDKSDQ